jgi:hypothetical protein
MSDERMFPQERDAIRGDARVRPKVWHCEVTLGNVASIVSAVVMIGGAAMGTFKHFDDQAERIGAVETEVRALDHEISETNAELHELTRTIVLSTGLRIIEPLPPPGGAAGVAGPGRK